MGPVSWMVNTVDAFLEGAAESSFAAVAGSLGSILMVASTLLIVLVFINLALQMRPMDGSTAVGLVVRLLLISTFALNWVQFNVVASAIIDGLDDLGAGAGRDRQAGRGCRPRPVLLAVPQGAGRPQAPQAARPL